MEKWEGDIPWIRIGTIFRYFDKINVAAIRLTGSLRIGDKIKIDGKGVSFIQVVESIQMNNASVSEAHSGDDVGIKLINEAKKGCEILKPAFENKHEPFPGE